MDQDRQIKTGLLRTKRRLSARNCIMALICTLIK